MRALRDIDVAFVPMNLPFTMTPEQAGESIMMHKRNRFGAALKSGDIGGQLRYMGTMAAGLVLAGFAPMASGFLDRALKLADEHPEAGFPSPSTARRC